MGVDMECWERLGCYGEGRFYGLRDGGWSGKEGMSKG